MKNNILKLISFVVIALFAMSAFAQRGSFGGGSRSSSSSFGGGRSSFSSGSGSSFSGRSSSFGSSSSFGGGRSYATPSYSRPSTYGSTRTYSSVRSSYRVGYRPSLSVHFYGNPYAWGGHQIYWYGGGYYSLYPGGPLILGNSGMPGYGAAYGYDPYGNVAPTGYAPVAPVAYNPLGLIIGFVIALLIVVIVIRAFSN